MQKIQILKILRVPSIWNQWVYLLKIYGNFVLNLNLNVHVFIPYLQTQTPLFLMYTLQESRSQGGHLYFKVGFIFIKWNTYTRTLFRVWHRKKNAILKKAGNLLIKYVFRVCYQTSWNDLCHKRYLHDWKVRFSTQMERLRFSPTPDQWLCFNVL